MPNRRYGSPVVRGLPGLAPTPKRRQPGTNSRNTLRLGAAASEVRR